MLKVAIPLLTLAVWLLQPASAQLNLNLDTKTGAYSILNNGKEWLYGAGFGIRANGKVYSTMDGSLKISGVFYDHSASFIGEYRVTTITFTDAAGAKMFAAAFNVYNSNVIHFEQMIPASMTNMSTGDNSDVITAFPMFNESKTDADMLNYLTWSGTFCNGEMGAWGKGSFGGGHRFGPLVLYDKSLDTFVMSSMDNFMVSYPSRSKSFGNSIAYGIGGKVNALPEGYVYSTILVAGQGVQSTMARWGSILLQLGKKYPSTLNSDPSISHLGYYTDNGAYYYYKTEPQKNYQQTMLDVKAKAAQLDIPFTYFQFDSWWYYKDHHSAVTLWEPRPDVFPDGMKKWLDLPLVLHNRWWSPENNYSHDWFIAEESCALPVNEKLFDYIMAKAKDWGMIVYEQDWLVTTYERMSVTQSSLYAAQNWLLYMGSAASKLNISVQYCMPLPMHMLQSTSIQSVTQARASGDYHPGNTNWNVGLTSLFYWSIGVVPFKDDFFTHDGEEANCPYGSKGCVEPNFELVTLVASLTGGPVGPSDGVDYLNKELIMRTCRKDGLLLKPDRPALFHDAAFKLGFDGQKRIELWHTQSNISGAATHYVLVISLEEEIQVTLEDLGESPGAAFIAFDYFASCPLGQEVCELEGMQHVNSTSPLVIKPPSNKKLRSGAVTFQYFVLAQTWPNGWTPVGEAGKLVPMSRQRLSAVSAPAGGPLTATVTGAPSEQVELYAIFPNGEFGPTTVVIPASGTATVTCTGNSASTAKCT
eukprot:scpid6634/ scgid0189/ 